MAVTIEDDLAGRDIRRVGIRLAPARLRELARSLVDGDPAIFPRSHLLKDGLLLLDVREVDPDDVAIIVERVREFLALAGLPRT